MKRSPNNTPCVISGNLFATKWYSIKEGEYVTSEQYLKDYYTKNKETILEKRRQEYANSVEIQKQCAEASKKYREANKETLSKRRKERYLANRERESKQQEKYRELNREEINKQKRERAAAHPEIIQAERKRHYEANKEAIQVKNKEYLKTPRGRYGLLISGANRRGIENTITFAEFLKLQESGVCWYCSNELPLEGYCLDRLDNNDGYHVHNVVLSCPPCNYIKSHILTPEEAKAAIIALKKYRLDRILPTKIIYALMDTAVERKRTVDHRYHLLCVNAQKKQIKNFLTLDQYKSLIENPCYYCGVELPKAGYGLDKLNPIGNYEISNCVPSCGFCNTIKWDRHTPEETIVIINAIQKYRIENNIPIRPYRSAVIFNAKDTEYHSNMRKEAFERHKTIVESHGMSLNMTYDEYSETNYRHKYVSIKCSKGHVFERYTERLNISNCPICTGKSNKSDGYIDRLNESGWKYISGAYKDKYSVLTVECCNKTQSTSQFRYLTTSKCSCNQCKYPIPTEFIKNELLDIPIDVPYFIKLKMQTFNKLVNRANELFVTLNIDYKEFLSRCEKASRADLSLIDATCSKGHAYSVNVNSFLKFNCSACSGHGGLGTKNNFVSKLEEVGWLWVSGDYSGQYSVLKCKCEHGTEVEDTYKNFRFKKCHCRQTTKDKLP